MELRQLRYFVKVAELHSFSEAAKELFISQSTISQQIRTLEGELGTELLLRDSRHVTLSDAGSQFLPYANKVLQDAEECRESLAEVDGLSVGRLRIGATYSFWPLLRDTVYTFLARYPGIKLDIYRGSMEDILEMLDRKSIDIGLSFKPLTMPESLDSRILFKSGLALVVEKGHPMAGFDSIVPEELSGLPLALPAKGLQARSVLDSILFGKGMNLDVRMEINDVSALLDLVLHNAGMCTVLASSTVRRFPQLVAVPINAPGAEMTGSFHTLKGIYLRKAARVLLGMLQKNQG